MKASIKRAYLGLKNWVEEMRPPKTHVKLFYTDTEVHRVCEAVLAVPAGDGEWWTIRHWRDGDGVSIYLNDSEFNFLHPVTGDREEKWDFIPEHLHEQVRGLSQISGFVSQSSEINPHPKPLPC